LCGIWALCGVLAAAAICDVDVDGNDDGMVMLFVLLL
jgi:hypothetical protein